MQKRTLYALFVFVALGLGAAWVLRASPERGITRLDLRQVATERVDAIELVAQGKTTRMSRHDGSWVLDEEGQADPDAIAALLAQVRHITTSDHVTDDEGRFGELGVQNEASTQVTLFAQSTPLTRFFIGTGGPKNEQAADKQLIRHEGHVFRLEGIDTSVFTRDPNSWEDRAVTRDTIEGVASVSFVPAAGDGYTLNQTEGVWSLAKDTKVPERYRFDANLARFYVNSLLNLHSQETVKQDPGVSVTKLDDKKADRVSWRLQPSAASGQNGSEETLLLGAAKDEQTMYVQVAGQPRVLLVNRPQAEGLKKPVQDLRALNMMDGPAFEDVVAATIRTADQKVFSFAKKSDASWALSEKTVAPKGFELDQNKLRARLRQALLARAIGIAQEEPAAKKQVKPFLGQVALTTSDKKVHLLTFGAQTKDKTSVTFFARGTADDLTYIATKALRDALLGGLATLSTQSPASTSTPSPQSLQNLPPELRRQIQEQLSKQKKSE